MLNHTLFYRRAMRHGAALAFAVPMLLSQGERALAGDASPLKLAQAAAGTPQVAPAPVPPNAAVPVKPGPASAAPAATAGAAPAAGTAPSVPQGQIAIVLNSRDAAVSLVDMTTFSEIGRVDVGKEPHHLYPTPDGKSLIVANAISNDLHYLDPLTGKIQKRLRGIDDPYQIGFSPDNKWFVANGLRLDRVDVYRVEDGELKVAKRIPLPKAPSHLWYSADSRYVFVTLQESDEIASIDLGTLEVAWKIKVGKQPAGIIVTPDEKYLMVGIMGADYVEVIDIRSRQSVKRIVTGKGAHNFRGAGDKRHVWVGNRVSNTINKIDMVELKVVDTIEVPGGPDCMEITADGRQMWITSRFAKQVTVVDLDQRKIVRQIPVGRSPHGIYFHQRAPLL